MTCSSPLDKTHGTRDPSWTFLSNHAYLPISIAAEPEIRMRRGHPVGITERAVQRIVAELEAGGYLKITREGRRNKYEVKNDLPLRHPVEAHRTVGDLVGLGLEGKRKK